MRELGASWAGSTEEAAPVPLDAAILFAPAGELVPLALRAVRKGGTVVCAGIHMSDIPSFPYRILWEERMLRSVANLTRRDGAWNSWRWRLGCRCTRRSRSILSVAPSQDEGMDCGSGWA